jgi:cellulose synthase/poly-beta-1,6-N-acetylglucosamine synthase-like glycosyltransferase
MRQLVRTAIPLLSIGAAMAFAIGGEGASARPDADFRVDVYLLASTAVLVDLIDFLVRLHQRRIRQSPLDPPRTASTSAPLDVGPFNPHQRKLHLRPFALAISVHDLGDELDDFVAGMQPYRAQLWVIDDASNDDTAQRLEAARIRVIRGARNRHKPGAIRELLHHLPADVETILVLDPDCRIVEPGGSDISALENVVFEFQRSRCAAACPRIAVRRQGWLSRFQRLEYVLAFALGRKSLRDFSITSGIALYRRASLEQMLARHSLSVYAEDLENTLHLLASREQVYYDERLVIETDG